MPCTIVAALHRNPTGHQAKLLMHQSFTGHDVMREDGLVLYIVQGKPAPRPFLDTFTELELKTMRHFKAGQDAVFG